MCKFERFDAFARNRINESTCNIQMIALIVKGGKILSYDTNKVGHRNKSIHAEANALRNLIRQKNSGEGADIFIYRLLANGNYGLARPCEDCMEYISKAGIKRIWYSDYGNRLIMERIH